MNLNNLKDELAKSSFGITKDEAQQKRICINCQNPIMGRVKTEAGVREYGITAMCEICFDTIFDTEGEDIAF